MDNDGGTRLTWRRKTEFLLSMLGYCVGLGNVWRFPYLTYDTGGGAFLVPYCIMLIFAGIPLMLLEMSLGQYASQGVISVWNSVPCMCGIGIGVLGAVTFAKISYMMITAYSFYYLFASFQRTLPWVGCHNDWNTVYCSELLKECLNQSSIIVGNGSCVSLTSMTSSDMQEYGVQELSPGHYDFTNYTDPLAGQRMRPSEQYWRIKVRQESSSINETGGIIWELVLCLVLSWMVIFIPLIKGIKSSGKVVYVTATFPYLLLFILLIVGLTLPGHQNGIRFFIRPKWEVLATPEAWLTAASQVFFSLGVSFGGIITLSSYNKFHNNAFRDGILVSLANSATSIFAGFVVFSILGFMAHELGTDVSSVVSEGYGLAFIVYPEAMSLLPLAPLWSIMFFTMLITLAMDSTFGDVEAFVTSIMDLLPKKYKRYRVPLLAAYCLTIFLMGLVCTTRAGPYWANLIDQSAIGIGVVLFAFMETLSISWIYGFRRFKNDIRSMIGDVWVDHASFWWWIVQWSIVTPIILGIILCFNVIYWTYPSYNGPFPSWALSISWLISCATVAPIPLVVIYYTLTSSGSFSERLKVMFSPTTTWGPLLQTDRLFAWNCHQQNGTTMGGKLEVGSMEDQDEMAKLSKISV